MPVFIYGRFYGMNVHKNNAISQESIEQKLGFTIKEYFENEKTKENVISHEKDNVPNPFDVLSLEELLYLREHGYFL